MLQWLIGIAFTIGLGAGFTLYQMNKPKAAILVGLLSWLLLGIEGAIRLWPYAQAANLQQQVAQVPTVRSWLTVQSVTTPEVQVGRPFQTVIRFTNSGQTPARNAQLATVIQPVAQGADPTFDYSKFERTGSAVIGPGGAFEATRNLTKMPDGSLGGLTLKDLKDIQSGKTVVFVHGHVDYVDGLGPHSTDFCFKLRIVQSPRTVSGLDAEWDAYKTHNSAS